MHAVRAPGHVDDGLGEGLVHRDPGVAEAPDSGLVAEGPLERLAEHDRDVLDGVVGVDLHVAGGADDEVERAVLAEGVEHVVEERDAGGHLGAPRAVEVDLDEDARLLGHALDAPGAAHRTRLPGRSAPPSTTPNGRSIRA